MRFVLDSGFVQVVAILLLSVVVVLLLANNLLMRAVWADLRQDIGAAHFDALMIDWNTSLERGNVMALLQRNDEALRRMIKLHAPKGTCAEALAPMPAEKETPHE